MDFSGLMKQESTDSEIKGSVKQVMKTLDRPKESTASGTPLGP